MSGHSVGPQLAVECRQTHRCRMQLTHRAASTLHTTSYYILCITSNTHPCIRCMISIDAHARTHTHTHAHTHTHTQVSRSDSLKRSSGARGLGEAELAILAADPTQRWDHKVDDPDLEKRRIEKYKAQRRQRCVCVCVCVCVCLPMATSLHAWIPNCPSACVYHRHISIDR
jgi:hypothetical protein